MSTGNCPSAQTALRGLCPYGETCLLLFPRLRRLVYRNCPSNRTQFSPPFGETCLPETCHRPRKLIPSLQMFLILYSLYSDLNYICANIHCFFILYNPTLLSNWSASTFFEVPSIVIVITLRRSESYVSLFLIKSAILSNSFSTSEWLSSPECAYAYGKSRAPIFIVETTFLWTGLYRWWFLSILSKNIGRKGWLVLLVPWQRIENRTAVIWCNNPWLKSGACKNPQEEAVRSCLNTLLQPFLITLTFQSKYVYGILLDIQWSSP